MKMPHKDVVIWLSRYTSYSKILNGSGDKIVNDLPPVSIIHHTCFKTYVTLLTQDDTET